MSKQTRKIDMKEGSSISSNFTKPPALKSQSLKPAGKDKINSNRKHSIHQASAATRHIFKNEWGVG
ncbi:hypothetical protein ACE1TI_16450 [Alteribacillus sp. JSM 102045]|uniref:hypothetical protein n=1 Tax=Alteribacillus sp. JSM 102045 TaxID=1562101 RepID=UPI0035C07E3C